MNPPRCCGTQCTRLPDGSYWYDNWYDDILEGVFWCCLMHLAKDSRRARRANGRPLLAGADPEKWWFYETIGQVSATNGP